ncbi:peptidase C65 Otubain-domain-containing protein [Mycena sp. CBHHK59/15]|nr:peptidase C65 Otubain-domain-containing protein [Mycena sp. CBHHK59/15]
MDTNIPTPSEDAPAAPRIRSSELPEVEPDVALYEPPAPRQIDENTPLSSLSQAEIDQLTEKLLNDPSTRNKLIAEITPISTLRAEYEAGSQSFVRQLDWLAEHGYNAFRRAARDGNCFYRSVAFSYLNRLLHAPNIPAAVERFRGVLMSKELSLTLAFEDDIHKEFAEPLHTLMALVNDFGIAITSEDLLDRLLEVSDHVSYYFRLLASAEIRTNPDPYHDFIPDQDIIAFCQSQVEAVNSEVDHIPMMALCNALRITLKVATLSSHGQGPVQESDLFTVISPDDAMDKDLPPILLLFRPGHYDILLGPSSD